MCRRCSLLSPAPCRMRQRRSRCSGIEGMTTVSDRRRRPQNMIHWQLDMHWSLKTATRCCLSPCQHLRRWSAIRSQQKALAMNVQSLKASHGIFPVAPRGSNLIGVVNGLFDRLWNVLTYLRRISNCDVDQVDRALNKRHVERVGPFA